MRNWLSRKVVAPSVGKSASLAALWQLITAI
jgi:hypothetical protein